MIYLRNLRLFKLLFYFFWLLGRKRIICRQRTSISQSIKKRALPHIRQTDNSYFQTHNQPVISVIISKYYNTLGYTISDMSKPIIFLVHGYNGTPKIFSYFKETFEKNGHQVVMPLFPTQTYITIDGYFNIF